MEVEKPLILNDNENLEDRQVLALKNGTMLKSYLLPSILPIFSPRIKDHTRTYNPKLISILDYMALSWFQHQLVPMDTDS